MLVKHDQESAYYCENPNCDRRQIEGLIHFASREAMNITGFGERIIEDFYNFGYIKTVVDFYQLDKISEELKELEIKRSNLISKTKDFKLWKKLKTFYGQLFLYWDNFWMFPKETWYCFKYFVVKNIANY